MRLIEAAFAGAAHASGREAIIVETLRESGALAVSLVAVQGDRVIGHVAFSPVAVSDGASGWFGLGPVAVLPGEQGRGIGGALIEADLAQLRASGANGCVVLSEADYY